MSLGDWRPAVVALSVATGLLIGVAIASASTPGSFAGSGAASRPRTESPPAPVPATAAAPTPAPAAAGTGALGAHPRLRGLGGGVVLAEGDNGRLLSRDSGATWAPLALPAGGADLAGQRGDPPLLLTGGSSVQLSRDLGATWSRPGVAPPPPPPYRSQMLSPDAPGVWFLVHGGRLLRTRDAGISWRDIPGLPPLQEPIMVAAAPNQALLASGGRVFVLEDNGNAVRDRGALPDGSVAVDLAWAGGGRPLLVARGSNGRLYVDGGEGWREAGSPLGGPLLATRGGRLVVGDGLGSSERAGALVYTTDGGATWRSGRGLPPRGTVEALALLDDDAQLLAYCQGGDLYRSNDGGAGWKVVSSALRG